MLERKVFSMFESKFFSMFERKVFSMLERKIFSMLGRKVFSMSGRRVFSMLGRKNLSGMSSFDRAFVTVTPLQKSRFQDGNFTLQKMLSSGRKHHSNNINSRGP